MLLSALIDYQQRPGHRRSPPGYRPATIHWWIDLDLAGALVGIRRTADGAGPRGGKVGVSVPVPYVRATNNVAARLLADTASNALGHPWPMVDARHRARTILGHAAFRDMVRECAHDTGEAAVATVARFLDHVTLAHLELPHDLHTVDSMAYRVADGRPVVELPAVQAWWASRQEQGQRERCLHCGDQRAISRVHPFVRGIPGGKPSGMALVSANSPAFQSYGRTQGYNAPLCNGCAQAYTSALSELLGDRRVCFDLPSSKTTVLLWTEDGSPHELTQLLADPEGYGLGSLAGYATPTPAGPAQDVRLRCAVLTPSGSRLVVRDWIETNLDAARRNVATFFQKQAVSSGDSQPRRFGIPTLERALHQRGGHRQKGDGFHDPPLVAAALLRNALLGQPPPRLVLHLALRRFAVSQPRPDRGGLHLGQPLVAVIRLALTGQAGRESHEQSPIDDGASAGYLCGRLFSLIGATQPGAHRYYGPASSVPAAILRPLLSRSRQGLARIRRADPALAGHYEKRIADVSSRIGELPASLSLHQQGWFALGYHDQRAGVVSPPTAAGLRTETRAA